MELIAWLIGLFRNIIIILLILLALFVLTVRFHQEYELLKNGLDGCHAEIKKLRKSRYQLVADMIKTFGAYAEPETLEQLKSMIKAYPKLRSAKAEAEWERKRSPIMSRYIKQIQKNVPAMMANPFAIAKKSFSTNEKSLSAQREMQSEVQDEMNAFKTNKFKMFFANLMTNFMNFSKSSHERVVQYEQEKKAAEEKAQAEKEERERLRAEQITTLHGADTGDQDLFISSLDELDETAPLDSDFAESITEEPEQLRRRDDMHKAARKNAARAERASSEDDLDGFDTPRRVAGKQNGSQANRRNGQNAGGWD